jgi:hypothetical protein
MANNFRVCGQCGESAERGGFAAIPGKDIFEQWRCLSCLLWDVRESLKKEGQTIKNVLVVKPEHEPNSRD